MDRVHLRRRNGRRTFEVYFTLEGRRVFKNLGTDDRRVAEDLRAELEFKLRRREFHLPRPIPVETALEACLAYQRGRRAPKGLETDEGYLRRALAGMRVEDLQELGWPCGGREGARSRRPRSCAASRVTARCPSSWKLCALRRPRSA